MKKVNYKSLDNTNAHTHRHKIEYHTLSHNPHILYTHSPNHAHTHTHTEIMSVV